MTGERPRRRLRPAALAAAVVVAGASVTAEIGQVVPEEELFLGVVVRGGEVGAVFARSRGDAYLVPLEETLAILGAELREDGGGYAVATPIGARALPPGAIEDVDGVPHLTTAFLSDALATPVRFSDELYALDVDLPWTPGDPIRADAPLDPAEAPPPPEPDARPPAAGLTRLFGEIGAGYATDSGEIDAAAVDLRLAGPGAGGLWQIRLEQELEPDMTFADPVVSDYIWVRPLADPLWLQIGNQRLTVGPLVGGAEVTGAQLAYSNRPEAFTFSGVSPGALLSGFGSGTRTFVGQGPPGGRAELWISDRRVAETVIGIDGVYEIEDAPLFGLQTDVEIRIFRRLGDASPIEVRRQTVTRAARFQPQGTLMALGGFGMEGNPLDPEEDADGALAFGRVVGAPFTWLTLGASGIGFDDGDLVGGIDGVIELGPWASASGSVAGDQGGVGAYEAGFSTRMGPVYFDASAFEVAEGFGDRFDDEDDEDEDDGPFDDDAFALLAPETLDRRAAAGAVFWDGRADFGIEARQTEYAEYVLPYGRVSPLPELTLSAAPDAMGEYRWEAGWRDADGFSARALRISDTTALRLDQRVDTPRFGAGSVFGDAVMDDDGSWRVTAGLSGERLGAFEVDWRMEAGAQDDAPIGWASFGRVLVPGVRGYVELAAWEEAVTGFAGLSLDLGVVDGRLTAGDEAPLDLRSGAVETVLIGPDGAPLALGPDERPEIRVDGAAPRWTEETPEGDTARIRRDGVARGVRRVEIDPGDLPIELSPARRVWHVAVAPATTTRLEVPLVLSLGVSGVLTTADGAPAAERRVEVIDAAGEVAATAVSNRFGQFRADGLPPGPYVARSEGVEAPFELTDDFVFGLALAGLPAPPTADGDGDADPAETPAPMLAAAPIGFAARPEAGTETPDAAGAPAGAAYGPTASAPRQPVETARRAGATAGGAKPHPAPRSGSHAGAAPDAEDLAAGAETPARGPTAAASSPTRNDVPSAAAAAPSAQGAGTTPDAPTTIAANETTVLRPAPVVAKTAPDAASSGPVAGTDATPPETTPSAWSLRSTTADAAPGATAPRPAGAGAAADASEPPSTRAAPTGGVSVARLAAAFDRLTPSFLGSAARTPASETETATPPAASPSARPPESSAATPAGQPARSTHAPDDGASHNAPSADAAPSPSLWSGAAERLSAAVSGALRPAADLGDRVRDLISPEARPDPPAPATAPSAPSRTRPGPPDTAPPSLWQPAPADAAPATAPRPRPRLAATTAVAAAEPAAPAG